MNPKSIGIVGGAGPLAGAFLLERIFYLSNKLYGCYRDADFPKVFLISFPFSEMLSPVIDKKLICDELNECLTQLRSNGASILAIACNTLHAFLEDKNDLDDLIHLPRLLAEEIAVSEKPLIFCTSTSVKFGLHKQFFPCNYPDNKTQNQVDEIIDQILKGVDKKVIINRLEKLLLAQAERIIVLGCTELSLFTNHLALFNKIIIDPLEMMANKILKNSFLV